jgi:SagB-type dehydrogenase family enzyme
VTQPLGIGDRFQQETSYDPDKLKGHYLDWTRRPETFKTYEAPICIYPLPEPQLPEFFSLLEALQNRRSLRVYEREAKLSPDVLASLLWATQGITAQHGEYLLRSAPSAGALYPIETYLFIRSVHQFAQGVYHFRPQLFDLEFLREGDFSRELAEYALGQTMIMKAQITFIWSAVLQRSKWKYKERAYRYIYLDAGHIAQNLYLAAEAFGLGVCAIGAFYDSHVNSLIGVDGMDETAVYMATVGKIQYR